MASSKLYPAVCRPGWCSPMPTPKNMPGVCLRYQPKSSDQRMG